MARGMDGIARPAAAVIPAPIAYIKVAAVKKLVVGFLIRCPWVIEVLGGWSRELGGFASLACALLCSGFDVSSEVIGVLGE